MSRVLKRNGMDQHTCKQKCYCLHQCEQWHFLQPAQRKKTEQKFGKRKKHTNCFACVGFCSTRRAKSLVDQIPINTLLCLHQPPRKRTNFAAQFSELAIWRLRTEAQPRNQQLWVVGELSARNCWLWERIASVESKERRGGFQRRYPHSSSKDYLQFQASLFVVLFCVVCFCTAYSFDEGSATKLLPAL